MVAGGIGKSTLIREAIKGRTHVFYQATRVTSSLNFESFKAEIAHNLRADDFQQASEAAQFVRYRAEDRLLTCGVFGGTPFYLELLNGAGAD